MGRVTGVVAAVVMLVATPMAAAHIEVTPATPPAGAKLAFSVSVPNERASADTVKVALRLPAGFTEVRGLVTGPWRGAVQDGRVVVFTGGRLSGTERGTFRFVARVPAAEGRTVTIPAVQTYSNGEVDRWIGGAGTALPAPTVTIAAPTPGTSPPPETTTTTTATTGTEPTGTTTPPTQTARAATTGDADDGGGGSTGVVVGVVVAALAGIAGLTIVLRRRSRRDDGG